MKTFLKNIFNKFRHRFTTEDINSKTTSIQAVAPFVTKSNRYKPDELSRFLNDNYRFRFNLLSEVTEYQSAHSKASEFSFLGEREMNTICIEAFNSGICCRDRDVKRYICSTYIETYHPFTCIWTVCRNGMVLTI